MDLGGLGGGRRRTWPAAATGASLEKKKVRWKKKVGGVQHILLTPL
jgi:hypothetical protein